jgi:hypothetical protein
MCQCVIVPIGDTLFAEIEYFAPSIVLEVDKRNYSLQRICDNYGHLINSNALCFEWRNVSFLFDEEKKALLKLNPVEFWLVLKNLKDFTGNCLFSNLSKIALFILCLPHSNAEVERMFSVVNDIKTKKPNKLSANHFSKMNKEMYS